MKYANEGPNVHQNASPAEILNDNLEHFKYEINKDNIKPAKYNPAKTKNVPK
jgi:hypothetical protein